MACLTVRDLPERTISTLKSRASINHRSLNGEILFIFDYIASFGDRFEFPMVAPADPEVEHQKDVILKIAGQWEDDRSLEEMVQDIEGGRTRGRKVEL